MAGRRQTFLWVRAILNPVAKVILRSPMHRVMSRRLLLITFPGRRSGKHYTTPISYVQQGHTLLLGVGGPWWKNLRGGVPVQVRLRGKTYAGRAEAWTDEASMTRVYRIILAHNPTQARFMGITNTSDGQPDSRDIQRALQREAAVVEVSLNPEQ
jgi:deazaflavin-dependent oxidoreductase (nitroreductase family)